MKKLKSLNNEQLQAIHFGNGPLLIIAGAGTGKTTVITERVKYLIDKKIAKPEQILALTFTEKAANEMETRIDQALPYGQSQVSILTFHSFCDRVLRNDGIHIGIDTNYKLITTAESINLLKKNLYVLGLDYFAPLGNPTKFIFGLLSHFSRLQDENIMVDEYVKYAKEIKIDPKDDATVLEKKKWVELSNAYKKYEELKIKNSFFDFGDLITKSILLFTKRPNVLKEYQERYKYILVDEFQDTNFAQNELVKLISGKGGNVTVVGDDDQSIYRFRGAAVSNMLQFRDHFPNTKIITLNTNYRSKQKILDLSHDLIAFNNPDRLEVLENINKKLKAVRSGNATILFNLSDQSFDEAEFVANKILEIHNNNECSFSDFAILVRANNHADSFVAALERQGIPYQFLGPGKLFFEPEIIDLISFLQVLTDISDDSALYRLLSMPVFEIDQLLLSKLSSQARKSHELLYEVCKGENLHPILNIIGDHLKRSRDESAGKLLLEFLTESGYRESLFKDESMDAVKKAQNIEKFFSKIKSFESLNPRATILELVDWINFQSEVGESPSSVDVDLTNEDKVNILTIHSSKGLEFPHVFLVNLVSQRFPSMERREQIPIPDKLIREVLPKGDYHLEEERRLFYVGMTRARDSLYLTAAKYYGEAKREKKVSQFVREALGEVNQKVTVALKDESVHPEFIQTVSPKVKVKRLSYSAIETFKICPLHYKLRYLLNIPVPSSPSQSFGISFHETMRNFYEEVKSGDKISKDKLHLILKQNWKKDGYLSKDHMEKSFKKAQNFVDYFYDNWFSYDSVPLSLEEPFSLKIKDLSINGKIDRIDKSGQAINIIDYKTGSNVMTQKEADKSLQLSIYALYASKQYSLRDITLSLIYFDNPQIIKTTRTQKDLDNAQEEILLVRKQIEESDFMCSGNFLCNDCEYKIYCKSS